MNLFSVTIWMICSSSLLNKSTFPHFIDAGLSHVISMTKIMLVGMMCARASMCLSNWVYSCFCHMNMAQVTHWPQMNWSHGDDWNWNHGLNLKIAESSWDYPNCLASLPMCEEWNCFVGHWDIFVVHCCILCCGNDWKYKRWQKPLFLNSDPHILQLQEMTKDILS